MKHKIIAIWFFLLVFTVPALAITEEESLQTLTALTRGVAS